MDFPQVYMDVLIDMAYEKGGEMAHWVTVANDNKEMGNPHRHEELQPVIQELAEEILALRAAISALSVEDEVKKIGNGEVRQ